MLLAPNSLTEQGLRLREYFRRATISAVLEWHIGDVVRKLRDRQRLTLEQLAAKSPPLNKNTISDFEDDPTKAKSDTFRRIAAALGFTEAQIYQWVPVSQESVRGVGHESSSVNSPVTVVKDAASSLSTFRGEHAAPQHPSADPSRRYQLAEAIAVLTAAADQLAQIAKAIEGDDTDEPDTGTAPSPARPPQRPTPRKRPSPRRDRR